MIIKGKPFRVLDSERWENTGVIKNDEARSYMEYFSRIVDIHDKLKEFAPNRLVEYFEFPILRSGYSMGEMIKCYVQDTLIGEEDFRSKYKGEYRGRENHGLVVVRFKTKKKLREYLEVCMEHQLLMCKSKKGYTEDLRKCLCETYKKKKDILIECVSDEESVIKKGYNIY